MGKHKRKRNPIVVKKSSVFQKGPLPYQEMESDTPSEQNKQESRSPRDREGFCASLGAILFKWIYGMSKQDFLELKDSGDSSFLSRILVFADNIITPVAYLFFAFWVKCIYGDMDFSWSSFLSLNGFSKFLWGIMFIVVFVLFWRPIGTRTPFSYLKNLLRWVSWLFFFIVSAFLTIGMLDFYAMARVGYLEDGLSYLTIPYMQLGIWLVSFAFLWVFRPDTAIIGIFDFSAEFDSEEDKSFDWFEGGSFLKETIKSHWKTFFFGGDDLGLAEDFSFPVAIKSFFLILDNLIVAFLYSLFFLWVNNYLGENASGCDLACSVSKTMAEVNAQYPSLLFYFVCFLCAFWRPIRKTRKLPLMSYFSGSEFKYALFAPIVLALIVSGFQGIFPDNSIEPLPFVVRFSRQCVFGILVYYRHIFLPYRVRQNSSLTGIRDYFSRFIYNVFVRNK